MRSVVLAILALFALSACEHTPPLTLDGEQCNIVRYSLEAPLPDEPPLESILGDNPGDLLLLSGGSENGAFGAGFLDGWHDSGEMPEFRLVAGISTGALQSTGVFIGQPEITVDGYTIDSEADLLETYVDGSDVRDRLSLGAAVTALRRGAFSDLIPLRTRLDAMLTPQVLEAVAARYDPSGNGAYLLAGATDLDLGQAVAFDLTELASRYAAAPTGSPERARFKNCYIEALVASSIVPPGARPVFIDNRMYIDGGVKYAVFDDRLGQILEDMPAVAAFPGPGVAAATEPRLFIILNGTGESRAVCGKVDDDDCLPLSNTSGQLMDWNVIDLAFRSLDLLTTQVERLSIERASRRFDEDEVRPHFARIRLDDLLIGSTPRAIPDFAGTKTCEEWRADDEADEDPVEFHRRYMRCLIEYGRERGMAQDWDFRP